MNARKSDIPSGMTVYLGGSPTPPLRPDASILLVALLIIGSISLPACIMPQSSYRDVVAFKVNLSPDGPAVLLVPIPVNEELIQSIHITQGTGNLSYVDTLHGRCLRIATSTYLSLSGSIEASGEDRSRLMTINLTTMNPNETIPDPLTTHQVLNRTIWLCLSSGNVTSLVINSEMKHERYIYTYTFTLQPSILQSDWNNVSMEGRVSKYST